MANYVPDRSSIATHRRLFPFRKVPIGDNRPHCFTRWVGSPRMHTSEVSLYGTFGYVWYRRQSACGVLPNCTRYSLHNASCFWASDLDDLRSPKLVGMAPIPMEILFAAVVLRRPGHIKVFLLNTLYRIEQPRSISMPKNARKSSTPPRKSAGKKAATAKAQVRASPSRRASTTPRRKKAGGRLDSGGAAPESSTFSPFDAASSTATTMQMNELSPFLSPADWSSPTPNYGNASLGMARNDPLFSTPPRSTPSVPTTSPLIHKHSKKAAITLASPLTFSAPEPAKRKRIPSAKARENAEVTSVDSDIETTPTKKQKPMPSTAPKAAQRKGKSRANPITEEEVEALLAPPESFSVSSDADKKKYRPTVPLPKKRQIVAPSDHVALKTPPPSPKKAKTRSPPSPKKKTVTPKKATAKKVTPTKKNSAKKSNTSTGGNGASTSPLNALPFNPFAVERDAAGNTIPTDLSYFDEASVQATPRKASDNDTSGSSDTEGSDDGDEDSDVEDEANEDDEPIEDDEALEDDEAEVDVFEEGLTLTAWSEDEDDGNAPIPVPTTRILPIPMDETYCQTFGQNPVRITGMYTQSLQDAIGDRNQQMIVKNALWSQGNPGQALNPALAPTGFVKRMDRSQNQTLMLAAPLSGVATFYSVMKIHGQTSLRTLSRLATTPNSATKSAKFGIGIPLADDWNHAVHYFANLFEHRVFQVQTREKNILFRTGMLEQTAGGIAIVPSGSDRPGPFQKGPYDHIPIFDARSTENWDIGTDAIKSLPLFQDELDDSAVIALGYNTRLYQGFGDGVPTDSSGRKWAIGLDPVWIVLLANAKIG